VAGPGEERERRRRRRRPVPVLRGLCFALQKLLIDFEFLGGLCKRQGLDLVSPCRLINSVIFGKI
jgi:hypothetical protein